MEQILLKALAKEPDNRYEDMNALIAAMEGVLAETQMVEVPAPIQQNMKKESSGVKLSPKMIMAVIGAMVIILILAFGIPWAQQKFSPAPVAEATSTKIIIPTATKDTHSSTHSNFIRCCANI